MARFLIQSPHTEEECTQTLDSVMGFSASLLNRFDWGCKAGQHMGWVVLEAQDEATALKMLPSMLRDDAKAIRLNKFSADEVKAFHEH